MKAASANFGFLLRHDPLLVRLGGLAELYAHTDPNTAILKLRQFAEALLQRAAARVGANVGPEKAQVDLIRELSGQGLLAREVADLFHLLRRSGNDAAHAFEGSSGEAVHLLKIARELGVWFHRTFGNQPGFRPGAFIPPSPPADPATELRTQVEQLRAEVEAQRRQAEEAGFTAELEAEERRRAEEQARAAAGERDTALQLAEEVERLLAEERARLMVELAAVRTEAAAQPPDQLQETLERAQVAAEAIELDEADTRRLIDGHLRDAGWEADTENLRYGKGARPQRGRNLAIAEWPTTAGPADYVLFAGLTPLAVVEAKRQARNVPASIEQAKRYSRGFQADSDVALSGPWGEYRIPFLFATNGRPYLKQIQERSGIWFLDARVPTNHARVLDGWYTPEGLSALLAQDVGAAEQALRESPSDYLPLRGYQHDAIRAVEAALQQGQRSALLAMATGTGKTRTLIGLVYRLIKAGRFRRVLFLVDRSALGEQATGVLKDVRLENLQSFTDIYDVKELGDARPDADTRLHVSTVQALVKRVLYAEPHEALPVDSYDCIVVDECHRGYTLDREMGETEISFRSEADYISKYRRVLEHFDAVRIGLTATPALHTTEIFGAPVYQYSYRQAVIDGWLVDHEPPVRIVTERAEDGIHYNAGDEVQVFNHVANQVELFRTPDEIDLEIDQFNRRVVTENFNRVVCGELARQIDPAEPGKTIIYCVTDAHADMVVRLLKEAFDEAYGGVEDDAVMKITGAADQPLQLIRRFKNERLPSVAVTVDLLTTGIDVPEVTNLGFVRRVRSRILYEQMLGRATRLAPDLYGSGRDKELFRIFDAVDLYTALEPHITMQPVVPNPSISFAKLVEELGNVTGDAPKRFVLDQLIAKLRRKRSRLEQIAEAFEAAAGMKPKDLADHLAEMTTEQAAAFFGEHSTLVPLLDQPIADGSDQVYISDHEDALRRVEHGYGAATRPEDYLESFGEYIRTHLNEIPALLLVVQRPRELTRKQLRDLKLVLDQAGYSETAIRTAWRDLTNQDIAASIIGYVRQQALGSPLVPYEERVSRAMRQILSSRAWTPPQRKWLERIGRQLEVETIVDRESIDSGQFRQQGGGFDRLNRIFEGELDTLLTDIQDTVWRDIA